MDPVKDNEGPSATAGSPSAGAPRPRRGDRRPGAGAPRRPRSRLRAGLAPSSSRSGGFGLPYLESIQDISVGAAGILAADYNGLLRLKLSGEIDERFGGVATPLEACPLGRGVGSIAEQGSRLIAFGQLD